MAVRSVKNIKRTRAEEYTVTFKSEALEKLKEYARDLNMSENELGEIIQKALRVIDLARDGKLVLEKYGQKFEIDLKKL